MVFTFGNRPLKRSHLLTAFLACVVPLALGCSVFSTNDPTSPEEEVNQAVYLWSEELGEYDNSFIMSVLEAEGADRLILTAGKPASMEKAYALQDTARSRGLTVEWLLAPNYWVQSDGTEEVAERLRPLDLRGSPLHLDIEPHAYDDFDEKEETYLRRYLQVIREASRIIGDNKLMVSIPFFWPAETHKNISEVVDRAYVMAYGDKSIDTRTEHARQATRHFQPSQRAVSLRPEDFSSMAALQNQAIPSMRKSLGSNDFALHDFEDIIESSDRN